MGRPALWQGTVPVVQRGRLVGVLSMRDVLGAGGAGAVEEDEV